MMEELSPVVQAEPLPDAIRLMLDRTGYGHMLEQEDTPEVARAPRQSRELVNAAAEAAERGESMGDFLDHAALVADADAVDEHAQVSLLTLHNAKGLEFPIVFLAGMEEGLFPHQRSIASVEAIEEERRLCYVGMTRAQQRLYLTWAKYRRRFGGGEQERTVASRFLSEVPPELVADMGDDESVPQVDLHAERYEVRRAPSATLLPARLTIRWITSRNSLPSAAWRSRRPSASRSCRGRACSGQASSPGSSPRAPSGAHRHDGGASQIWYRNGGAARRRWRRC